MGDPSPGDKSRIHFGSRSGKTPRLPDQGQLAADLVLLLLHDMIHDLRNRDRQGIFLVRATLPLGGKLPALYPSRTGEVFHCHAHFGLPQVLDPGTAQEIVGIVTGTG